MNWYKRAQLESELGYYEELGKEYTPEPNKLKQKLQDEYGLQIVSKIGQGDNGQAYLLSNGDVLKITTNSKEGKNAVWLKDNPHPNIAEYKDVWQEGKLYFIIMEQVSTSVPEMIRKLLDFLDVKIQQYDCFTTICAEKMFEKIMNVNAWLKQNPLVSSIMSYLHHIASLKAFDFLNLDNVGLKNGTLKFFDIT